MIRLTVMMYVCYPSSLRQVENLLSEHGVAICYETVRSFFSFIATGDITSFWISPMVICFGFGAATDTDGMGEGK